MRVARERGTGLTVRAPSPAPKRTPDAQQPPNSRNHSPGCAAAPVLMLVNVLRLRLVTVLIGKLRRMRHASTNLATGTASWLLPLMKKVVMETRAALAERSLAEITSVATLRKVAARASPGLSLLQTLLMRGRKRSLRCLSWSVGIVVPTYASLVVISVGESSSRISVGELSGSFLATV